MGKPTLEEYLSKSNAQLLADSTWGSQGESDFIRFMNVVRYQYKETTENIISNKNT